MMKPETMKFETLTRRAFVRMAGMASLATQSLRLRAATPDAKSEALPLRRPRYAYVGAIAEEHAQGVSVYDIQSRPWKLQQFVATRAPVALALHPSGRTLYVLNAIGEYQGLPSGSVESYSVDAESGQVALLSRQGLSLSAIYPRHMAVSPDGKTLAVAVDGGGAYNLLPIHEEGQLGRVSSIVKEIGSGPVAEHQKVARPQTVLFDTSGDRVISSDLGSDRLSVFSVAGGLAVSSRHSMPAGSGPRHIAMHPSGHLLYVSHALGHSLSCFGYDAATGGISESPIQVYGEYAEALAIHPSGDLLFSASAGDIQQWRIDRSTGAIRKMATRRTLVKAIDHLHSLPDGSGVLAVSAQGILHLQLDTIAGYLDEPVLVAGLPGARSIAIQ